MVNKVTSDLTSAVMTDFRIEGLVRLGVTPYTNYFPLGGWIASNDVIETQVRETLTLQVTSTGATDFLYTCDETIEDWWNANAETGNSAANPMLPYQRGLTDFFFAIAFDADDGASSSQASFYLKQWPWESYTQIGTDQGDAVFTQATPAAPWLVGVDPAGGGAPDEFTGRFYWVKGYDDKAGASRIFSPMFNEQAATGGEWSDDGPNDDTEGNTWTLSSVPRQGASEGRYVSSLYGAEQSESDLNYDMS